MKIDNKPADYKVSYTDASEDIFADECFIRHESVIIKEIIDYVKKTYDSHYAHKNNLQTIDYIISKDMGIEYCLCNIMKYCDRYGNKDGYNRKDILKIIHYGMFLLYIDNLKGEENES